MWWILQINCSSPLCHLRSHFLIPHYPNVTYNKILLYFLFSFFDRPGDYSKWSEGLCHIMRRSRCVETVCGGAHGDITYKPMRGINLVRRCRLCRTVPQFATAELDRRNAPSSRLSWESTRISMHVVTPNDYAASGAPTNHLPLQHYAGVTLCVVAASVKPMTCILSPISGKGAHAIPSSQRR